VRLLRPRHRKDTAPECRDRGRARQPRESARRDRDQDTDIPDDVLRKALQDAGYDVKAITRTERSLQSLREQVKAKK
jgi:hypothetical protein